MDVQIKQYEELLKQDSTNDLARLATIEKLLELYINKSRLPLDNKEKSDTKKRIKELKRERSKLNPMNYMSKIESTADITPWIKCCDDYISEMWKNFNETHNATILIDYLCLSDNSVSINKFEEDICKKSEYKLPTLDDLMKNPEIAKNPTKFGFKDNNIETNPDCLLDCLNVSYYGRDNKERIYSENEEENKIIQKTLSQFKFTYNVICLTLIKKILDDIKNKINAFDVDKLLKTLMINLVRNRIIPKDRRETFSIIISYGFYENYITTSYMIPAQIEYLLLELLKSENENVYKYDKNGKLNQDIILEDLFGNDDWLKKLESIFNKKSIDVKILHNLKYLLKYDNIRNDIYHGKCNDNHLKSETGMYLWFLFVKLLYHLFKAKIATNSKFYLQD